MSFLRRLVEVLLGSISLLIVKLVVIAGDHLPDLGVLGLGQQAHHPGDNLPDGAEILQDVCATKVGASNEAVYQWSH
eukprot:1697451-Pyramimonas_sp.AAC.1